METLATTELELRRLIGPSLETHVALQDQLAFGVGGVADFFVDVHTLDELVRAVSAAQTTQVPYLVIGQGSQVVISDYGFPGLIILNRADRIEFVANSGHVLVESGATWPKVILQAASGGLGGFESLLGLPGSIGGTLATRRLGPTGLAAHQALRSVTLLTRNGAINRYRSLSTRQSDEATILVASLQLIQTRRDELLRRIRHFELERRRFSANSRRFLGPVFHSDFAGPDPSYLVNQFRRAKILDLRVAGAVFSAERPNYIEARGRVSARAIRELTRLLYDRLSESGRAESLSCQLSFVGSWGDEVES